MLVNTPELLVILGDVPVYGAISLEVEQVAYFAADRFVLTLAVGVSPQLDVSFFASAGMQLITISVATSASGYVNLIIGQIDNVQFDLTVNTVTLSGRDLSARLIDTEIAETFANQTASQIASTIADRHGLIANVTSTTVPVGQYYELDHARSALGVNSRTGSEWNMLCFLALAENFILSVTGMTLNFGPLRTATPTTLTPAECISISLDIAATIPTTAIVKSWNTRNKLAVVQTVGGALGGSTTLIRPNLTNQQALSIATNHLSILSQHGTVLVATLPGETVLAPASQLTLVGSNTPFDQTYVVDTITRYLDAKRGFIEAIRAHAIVN